MAIQNVGLTPISACFDFVVIVFNRWRRVVCRQLSTPGGVPMWRDRVPLPAESGSVRPCIRVSVCPCVRAPARPCVRASAHPCARAPVGPCVRVSVRPYDYPNLNPTITQEYPNPKIIVMCLSVCRQRRTAGGRPGRLPAAS